jgi:RNA polymerase sigma-70 factor, ECF subfamily
MMIVFGQRAMARVTHSRATPRELESRSPTIEDVVHLYSDYVATIGLRILGRRSELEDLVQDVFLEAHRNLGSLRDPQALRAWLATVTVRVARRMLRKRWLASVILPFAGGPDFDPVDPGASAEEGHLLSCVYGALDRLPANQRIAWTLQTLHGERLDRIAILCGCSLAAVKRRIAKAQAALARELGHG